MTDVPKNRQRLLASCLRTLPDSYVGVNFSRYPSGESLLGMIHVPPYRVPELKEMLERECDAEQQFKLLLELAVEHRNWREFTEAIDTYHHALQIYPLATRPFYGSGECLIQVEHYRDAVKTLSDGLKVFDRLPTRTAEPVVDSPLAQKEWTPLDNDRRERRLPTRADFLELLCDAQEKMGDYPKALEHARQLCKLEQRKDSYHACATRLQLACGESISSIANERALCLLQDFEPELASELGRLYEIFGADQNASQTYQRLLKNLERVGPPGSEEWEESDNLRGWLHDRLGRHEDAIKCFSSLLEHVDKESSKGIMLKVLLANAKLHSGDTCRALSIYAECLDAPGNHEALNNVGIAHFLTGNYSDALSAFETARDKVPEHPVINFNYALIALALADRKFAEEQIRPLRKINAALGDRLHLLLESHATNLQIDLVPGPPLEVSVVQ